jgi:hypothetical protein
MATPPFLPDESKPADGDVVSQYPAVERTFRDIMESWLLVDHDTDGEHVQVTLPESAGDPTNATDTGFVYTKDDGGDTELFYIDAAGNVVQLTVDGAINIVQFPATTSMLFYQATAPTGWTKDTTTLNNHAIRVVSSTAWAGGSNGATGFTSVFGSGKTVGGTAISTAQMPSHTHGWGGSLDRVGTGAFTVSRPGNSQSTTGSTGSGNTHNHTLSLDLNYINVIRATKD